MFTSNILVVKKWSNRINWYLIIINNQLIKRLSGCWHCMFLSHAFVHEQSSLYIVHQSFLHDIFSYFQFNLFVPYKDIRKNKWQRLDINYLKQAFTQHVPSTFRYLDVIYTNQIFMWLKSDFLWVNTGIGREYSL